jgi:hypothetical protein
VPEPGKPDDVWWLGFDCAHSGDAMPYRSYLDYNTPGETYRDIFYVTKEVTALAKQLHKRGSSD